MNDFISYQNNTPQIPKMLETIVKYLSTVTNGITYAQTLTKRTKLFSLLWPGSGYICGAFGEKRECGRNVH